MDRTAKSPIPVGAMTVTFLVEAEDSGGTVTMFECDVPAAARMPAPHSHDGFEETIYGLRGRVTYTVDGSAHEIGPGDAICVPRGAIHGFQNDGTEDARMLAIATPGVFGPSYFEEVGEVLAAAGDGPPDRAAIVEVMRRHGLTPAQPTSA